MLKYDTLKNMNGSTAKHAVWCVRILDPKIIKYTFTCKDEIIQAEKFQCLLVSNDPKEYMLGSVPFSFAQRDAARKAESQFKDGSVWILKTPAFDTKMKSEYNSCPQETVVLLTTPSKFTGISPTHRGTVAPLEIYRSAA